jgi:hypothetical protein
MIPVVVQFADEAHADSFIAVITAAKAINIQKTKDDATGKVTVTFDEPDDDD